MAEDQRNRKTVFVGKSGWCTFLAMKSPPVLTGSNCLFGKAGNISEDTDQQAIFSAFNFFGDILDIQIPADPVKSESPSSPNYGSLFPILAD